MLNFLTKFFGKQTQTIPYSNRGFNVGGAIPSDWSAEDYLQSYQTVGWWHAVVFRIALGMSEVKWTLFDVSSPQKPKQIFKHPLLSLLSLANPFQTSEELIALDTIYMECLGESFWVLNYNAIGEPAEIILPYPTSMQVVPDKNFPFVKGYVYGRGADQVPLDVNQVIHFKYPNPMNQFRGLGQATAIGVNLSAERNADKWVDQFFYNSARPDGVIQFDYSLSDEQFDKLKKQWSEKYKGVNKAHQVALLEGGGKYVQIQNAVKDMDFPNLKQKNRDIILGVESMPLSIMGISENVNKAEAETGDYTFARWILKPRLNWKKAKLQEQLVPKFKNSQNLKLGFEEIVPETAEQRRLDAESGMRAGYLTVNEARAATGKDPLPPNVGDVLLVPLNLIPTPVTGRLATPPQLTEEPKSKSLTPDQRRIHWERFAQKTSRQEEVFKKVFSKVFDGQRDLISETFERTHELPSTLDDETTARKFEPIIQLVYTSGFEDALPKQEEVLDEHALEWIATRSLFLAKSINKTTLELLRAELRAGFAEGESIQQIAKRIVDYFDSTKKWKAEQVARSEVIAASNEGALYRYTQAGVDKAVFTVSFGACPVCLDLDGKEYPVAEAHGVIPVHSNCRCVWTGMV